MDRVTYPFPELKGEHDQYGGLCDGRPGTRTVARQEVNLAAGKQNGDQYDDDFAASTNTTCERASQFHNRGRPRLFVAIVPQGALDSQSRIRNMRLAR